MNKVLFIFSLLVLASSCKPKLSEVPEAPIVVKGYLTGGEGVNDIYLEHVLTSREFESQRNVPIENADVSLIVDGDVIVLEADPERDGYYINLDHEVRLNSTYELVVNYEDQKISSSCRIPDELNVTTFSKPNSEDNVTTVGGMNGGDDVVVMSISWEADENYEYLLDLTVEDENPDELMFNEAEGRFDDLYASPIKATTSDFLGVDILDVDFSYTGRHTLTIYTFSPEYSKYLNYVPTSFNRNLYDAPNNILNGYGVFAGLSSTNFEIILAE